jgi:hypothetical protein
MFYCPKNEKPSLPGDGLRDCEFQSELGSRRFRNPNYEKAMNNNNLAPSTSVVNNKRCNKHSIPKNRECSECRYAPFPNTGHCTNFECPHYERSGAITGDQLLKDYEPPRLFHGRRWGSWTLDTERLCLVHQAEPSIRCEGRHDQYTAYFGIWEIDLERIRDSAAMLDWIFQFDEKVWATARASKDLLNALDDIFDPQACLCSGACGSGRGGKIIDNPGAFLRKRIATVGKDGPPLRDAA